MATSTVWALVFLGLISLTPILALSKDTSSALDHVDTSEQGQIHERRHRRGIDFALSVFGTLHTIFTTIASAGSDPNGEILAKLGEIKAELQEVNQKLDQLSAQVTSVLRSIEQLHDVTRIASVFSGDIIRLNYYKLFLENDANYNANNQIIINDHSRSWADAVLSQSPGGMGPLLNSVHVMITGSAMLKPIRDVYMNGLLASHEPDLWAKMDTLKDTLISMEVVGYSLWAMAFDIKGRSGEKVTTAQRLMESRFEIQREYLGADDRLRIWPAGSYGLVKSAEGCPSGGWATGSRFHDTEDSSSSNGWTPNDFNNYISATYGKNDMTLEFCMHGESDSTVQFWPSGKYCIFAYSSSCPSGFTRGSLFFDDEDHNNRNLRHGEIPSGSYGGDTKYEFCCRTDGSENTEIVLPFDRPFVLFPLHSYGCQKVDAMKVTEVEFYWDCENWGNVNKRNWPYPKERNQGQDMLIHMCYYTG